MKTRAEMNVEAGSLFLDTADRAAKECELYAPAAIARQDYRFTVGIPARGQHFGRRVERELQRRLRSAGWERATVDWQESSNAYGDQEWLSVYLVPKARPRSLWSRLFGGVS